METETNNPGCACGTPGCSGSNTQLVTIQLDSMTRPVQFTRAELQGVVQAAYDQAGILAEPSFAVEQAQAEGRAVAALEAHANAAHNTGVRA